VILEDYLATCRGRIDGALQELLPAAGGPAGTVSRAMRYAVLGGGKRLRPILAIAACEACGGSIEDVLEPAAALELLHTYSLIHDDLPAMDNDDLRRGRPTVHREFSEAVAILAGDALHTLCFELLSTCPVGQRFVERRLESITLVSRCAGVGGMVGGQIADLEGEGSELGMEGLNWIHRHKTGALFAASAELGAIHAGAGSAGRSALSRYGRTLGLAFQITDDILDTTATAGELGKTPGKDIRSGKATYPSVIGLQESRARAVALIREALSMLAPLGLLSETLRALGDHVVARTS
jgi:geranylgeranyl diphosphate synthase type II